MSELPPEQAPLPPPPPPPPPDAFNWQPAPPPAPAPRSRRGLAALLGIAIVAVLVIGAVGGYALAGKSMADNRINAAQTVLGSAISHQSDFADSMAKINEGFAGISGTSLSPTEYKASVDQFVQSSQQDQATLTDDRTKIDAAGARLHDTEWLTLFYRGSIDHESTRIQHADRALDAARTVAMDFVQDGAFFEALADTILDLNDVGNRSRAGDFVGATASVAKLKTDTGKALSLAGAPGMPDEVHQLMVGLQNLANDFESLFNASASGNSSAVAAAEAKSNADAAALKNIDTSATQDKIDAFYQPYETTYKQEMQLAES